MKKQEYYDDFSLLLKNFITKDIKYNDFFVFINNNKIKKTKGWKIHISANKGNFERILKTSVDYLIKNNVPFKFIKNLEKFKEMNSKHFPRKNSGKFITIYPKSNKIFKKVETRELVRRIRNKSILLDNKCMKALQRKTGSGRPPKRDDSDIPSIIAN